MLFGLAVVVLPAAIVIAALGIVCFVAQRAMPAATTAVIGALAALAIVPMIDRTTRLSSVVFIVLLAVIAAITVWCYRRWSALRTYTTYLAPAPVLFLAMFLFASPSSVLLNRAEEVDAAALHGSNTPVIYLVFDEFPLGVLLDTDGKIDAARYPGFARLAATST